MSTAESTRRRRPETIAEIHARDELVRVATQRKIILEEIEEIQRRAIAYHAEERARAKSLHREANRELLEAAHYARAVGMPFGEIASTLGMKPNTLRQLRRTADAWDTEKEEADK